MRRAPAFDQATAERLTASLIAIDISPVAVFLTRLRLALALRSAGIEGENVRRVDLVLDDVPEAVASATGNAVRNAVHLVTVLRQNAYPPYE